MLQETKPVVFSAICPVCGRGMAQNNLFCCLDCYNKDHNL
jgi:hypothetical protein